MHCCGRVQLAQVHWKNARRTFTLAPGGGPPGELLAGRAESSYQLIHSSLVVQQGRMIQRIRPLPRGRENAAPPRGRSRARARRTQGVRSTSAGDTPPHLGTPESDTPSHTGDEPDAEPGEICSPTVFAESSSEDSDTQTPAGAGSEAQPSTAKAAAAVPTAKASSQQTIYQRAAGSYQPAASLVQVVQDSPSPARRQSSPQRRQASRNPAGAGGPGGAPPEREASKSPKTDLSLHGNPMLHQSGEQTALLKKAQTAILHRWGGSALWAATGEDTGARAT